MIIFKQTFSYIVYNNNQIALKNTFADAMGVT